jgi:DNA-binding NarL/FixJ family response regulator
MSHSGPFRALTDRQWQIVDGIRRGLSYEEIGVELGLSPYTVRNHVKAIAPKFNNPDELEPRLVIALWARHEQWEQGRPAILSGVAA